MNDRLLREYVSALVIERIRSGKGRFGNDTKFNLKTFKTLDNVDSMREYADTFLKQLGKGSSRVAYLMSSRYVLKIALNDAGLAQNKAEVDVYTDAKTRPIVANVHASHDRYAWVVEDLVKELTDPREFESLTGIDWRTFEASINGIKSKSPPRIQDGKGKQFVDAVIDTAKKLQLGLGDIKRLEHWGKSPDGRAVLLDFGYTEEVWQQHYSNPKSPKADSPSARDKTTAKPGQDDSTVPDKRVR